VLKKWKNESGYPLWWAQTGVPCSSRTTLLPVIGWTPLALSNQRPPPKGIISPC